MENQYKNKLAYLNYVKSDIIDTIDDMDDHSLGRAIQKYELALAAVDEKKETYVSTCLESDVERQKVLEWVEGQKSVFKDANQFKRELTQKLEEMRRVEEQKVIQRKNNIEEQLSEHKEKLEVERNKRIAEQQQKINTLS